MKVLLLNGSPHKDGAVAEGLKEAQGVFEQKGIDTLWIHIGNRAIRGCNACEKCYGKGRCVYEDKANEVIDAMKDCDGIIIGSPVYYAGINGSLKSLLDRVFNAGSDVFKYKAASCIVNARRAGTTAAYDDINKYFGISGMVISPSRYWNMTHGNSAEEVIQDEEGMGTVRVIANSMSWLLKVLEDGKRKYGIPERYPVKGTNFIR
ncbi:MAG: flavodoxin family protein [Eubacteriaceae bacterium]|nr:flavodoxin family protein [Eubacteriaceae bacterium]